MCGRFSFATNKEKVIKEFPKLQLDLPLEINYNVAPTQDAYVINNNFPNVLTTFRWGLIPNWTKPGASLRTLINARSESIFSKASFRMPIRKRRCIVLADSFYEWKREGKKKMPYRILPQDDALLKMAGIWDTWRTPSGELIYSFAIITIPPNQEVANIHDRMPVLLQEKSAQEAWLSDIPKEEIDNLMQTIADDYLKIYPISPLVNSVKSTMKQIHDEYHAPPTLF